MNFTIKCAFGGMSGVGKTAILTRLKFNRFNQYNTPTIQRDFQSITITHEKQKYTLQLWDTAGQEKFRSISMMAFKSAKIILLVFDLSVDDSFKDLENWMERINDTCNPSIKIILLGNKCDLEQRNVDVSSIQKFMKKYHINLYFETSALTGYNIDAIPKWCIEILSEDTTSYDENISPIDLIDKPTQKQSCNC